MATLFVALVVLVVFVALPLSENVLARQAHAELCGLEAEPESVRTDGTGSVYLLGLMEFEEEAEREEEELRRLAQGLVYEPGLSSPLSPPMLPTGPLFAPLPAANSNSEAAAQNG
ncbi:hypothetical protein GF391_03595 [Candidatus Uhrbacteria bacterium]|nr:hypothetical protein [Candidatus Uhrbacteria bacterium]